MGQLRPFIGDKRLGDIVIPATHDSGTTGINKDSHVIDKTFLFKLAKIVTPNVLVNWSITQDRDLSAQLQAGYRAFDLRIADVEQFGDTFRWWHGLSADEIFEGLQQIHDFAIEHPEEILLLEFGHFAAPSNSGITDIPIYRKDEIANILLKYLEPVLVPKSGFSNNPTMNEVLAIGKNVIIHMGDHYIRGKSDLFWSPFIHSSWSGRTNPEDLFEERSFKLSYFKNNYNDRITLISGCVTPDEKTIAGAMVRLFGNNFIVKMIIKLLLPGLSAPPADKMSFEGIYTDLLSQAKHGTNTGGMFIRPATSYTNGASVQYMGVNQQWIYWLGRPDVYKVNIISVDDFVSSNAVDVAIQANMGEIPRQTSVSFQGNTRDGFYEWVNARAVGGSEGHECQNIEVRYSVEYDGQQLFQEASQLADSWTVVFGEGDYPKEAHVVVEVLTPSGQWVELYNANIQQMITNSQDVYVRGSDQGNNHGFVYVSEQYNLFGDDCITPPKDGYLEMLSW